MPRVAPLALVRGPDPEASAIVGARIAAARAVALARPSAALNGRLTGRALREACRLDLRTERRIVALADLERASGRGTERLLRVARTIADLAGSVAVEETTSTRRPGSGRPTCGWPPQRSAEVLGVGTTGPTGVASMEPGGDARIPAHPSLRWRTRGLAPRSGMRGRSWRACEGSDRSASGRCWLATGPRSRSCARRHPLAARRAWRMF